MTLLGVPALVQHSVLGLSVLLRLLPGWTGILLLSTQIIGTSQFFAMDSGGRWLTLLLLAIASLGARARNPAPLVVWLGYLLLSSILFSVWSDLSSSKALSIILATMTIARLSGAASNIKKSEVLDVWFGSMVLGSLALIVLGAGIGRGGWTGLTTHAQTLGLLAAFAFVWFANGIIQGVSETRWSRAMAIASLVLLVLSASRTAVISSFTGVLLGILAAWMGVGPVARGRRAQMSANAGVIIILGVLTLLLIGGARIESFLQKGKDVELDPVSLILEARGGQMDASLRNWESQPFFGIGLGVPSYFDVPGARDAIQYVGSIPVALSVEKGFGITAVLEELGIVGSILTWGGLAILLLGSLRSAGIRFAGLGATAVLSNAGDFALLSVGGPGLLVWTCILASLQPRPRRVAE